MRRPEDTYIPINRVPDRTQLRYVSTHKLQNDLDAPTQKGGKGAGVSGFSGNYATRNLTQGEQIKAVTDQLELSNHLVENAIPRKGDYFLIRFAGQAGSAWAWAGGGKDYLDTAWWIGVSGKYQILAYGNRKHLLGGSVPQPNQNDVATWWPSRLLGYKELLQDINKIVNDDPDVTTDKYTPEEYSDLFESFVFSDGVERGESYSEWGIYSALIRVDAVDYKNNEEKNRITIFGSPLWVAEEQIAHPGTYLVGKKCSSYCLVATWNGNNRGWSNYRYLKQYENTKTPNVPSTYPSGPPNPLDVISFELDYNQF